MTLTRKQIISIFLLLALLFSLPVAIYLTRKRQDVRPRALQGKANFLLSADSITSSVGKNIDVLVSLQLTDPQLKVSGVDFLLLYDKNKLDVGNVVPNITSTNPAAPFTEAPIVTSGGSFDENFNFVRVAEISRRATEHLPSGTFQLAKITFRGRAEGSATIKFPDDNKYLEVVGVGGEIDQPTGVSPTPTGPSPTAGGPSITPGGPSPTSPPRSWNSGACRTWCRGQGATAATCESACVNYDSCMSNCRTVASESQCSGVCNGFYTN